MYTSLAVDSKEDHHAFTTNPWETSNLLHTVCLKVGACVMLTNNVNVPDSLKRVQLSTVAHIVMEKHNSRGGKSIKAVLV